MKEKLRIKRMNKEFSNKKYWNGDLGKAFERLEEVEQKKKNLDRKQLAEINEKR